ncbi:hypothetical protein FH972_021655 [Carpinus fangiana]|uniref:Uncharacterized protein n=1 Tax=Carpinus fangiana TaxID=176857 RepID=A0A5N6KQB2_9ROSI|nr:hypothetical protein FH972_021655 [Carpinus fangiana]
MCRRNRQRPLRTAAIAACAYVSTMKVPLDIESSANYVKDQGSSIESTLASVQDDGERAEQAQVPPPRYSAVWSEPAAVASVHSADKQSLDERILHANLIEHERMRYLPNEQLYSSGDAEILRLTLPADASKRCCWARPGDQMYWSCHFRKQLKHQKSQHEAAVLIREAVESICGVSQMNTEGLMFEVDRSYAGVLAMWAGRTARSRLSIESLTGKFTMEQLAQRIGMGSHFMKRWKY